MGCATHAQPVYGVCHVISYLGTGYRSSRAFRSSSAQRTASAIADLVAGTLFPPSKPDSFLAARIDAAISKTRLRPSSIQSMVPYVSLFIRQSDGRQISGKLAAMKPISTVALLLITTACQSAQQSRTVLLGGAHNMNGKCVGHAAGLCGTEEKMLPTEIAGIFATETDCQGLHLRGLTDAERNTPGNQLPLLLDVYYEGTHAQPYLGTGKGEDEGWMFTFNGPQGHFSATVRTEHELVSSVCKAAKGLGAEIDKSVGYIHSE